MIATIKDTFHWLTEQLPGPVLRRDNESYTGTTAIWARPVDCPILKATARLLSVAAAALALFAAVGADAQQPTTRSVVIPPIPPGQARIWIYRGSQPTSPFNYPHVEAITLNGATVGYEQLGGAFYRNVPAGRYVIAAPGLPLDNDESTTVDLFPSQEAYLKLDAIGWPAGGENMVDVYALHLIPPQIGHTMVAQLAFLGGN